MTSIQAANLSGHPGPARRIIVGGRSGVLAAEGRTAVHNAKDGAAAHRNRRGCVVLARGGALERSVPLNFSRSLKASGGLHSSLRDQAAKHARKHTAKYFRSFSSVIVHVDDNGGRIGQGVVRA